MSTSSRIIVGIDEAGRGPWAGPVVAAAVSLGKGCDLQLLGDSKVLTESARKRAYAHIIRHCTVHIGIASAEEIDEYSIKRATFLAMSRALGGFRPLPDHVLVDGNDRFVFPCSSECIVGGDGLVPVIGAASIVAKVFRDHLMDLYHSVYPQYGFDTHRGYGTKKHQQMLAAYGICPLHRKSYRPIKEHLAT